MCQVVHPYPTLVAYLIGATSLTACRSHPIEANGGIVPKPYTVDAGPTDAGANGVADQAKPADAGKPGAVALPPGVTPATRSTMAELKNVLKLRRSNASMTKGISMPVPRTTKSASV